MKEYFKLEFKRTLFSGRTIISILIIIALFIVAYLQDVVHFIPTSDKIIYPFPGIDGIEYYIRISHSCYIGFVGPIVAGVIYSTSTIKERKSGFLNKLMDIIDAKTYYLIKLIVNALTTFIAFAVGHGIVVLYLIVRFGISNTMSKDMGVPPENIFSNVYGVSKVTWMLLILMTIAISTAAFSTFIFGFTSVFESKLITYIFSVFYTVVTGILFEIWSLNSVIDFNVTKLFNLIVHSNTRIFSIILYDLILTTIGLLLIYKYGYKRELDSYSQC